MGNQDCNSELFCAENKTCLDPCTVQPCGENASCTVKEHNRDCKCPPNTSGEPYRICRTIGNECDEDLDCTKNKNLICDVGNCIDVCINHKCGEGAECHLQQLYRSPHCECISGFRAIKGNPNVGCQPKNKLKSQNVTEKSNSSELIFPTDAPFNKK